LEVGERVAELEGAVGEVAQDDVVAVAELGHVDLRGADGELDVLAGAQPHGVGGALRAPAELDVRAFGVSRGGDDGAVDVVAGQGADVGGLAPGPHGDQADDGEGRDDRHAHAEPDPDVVRALALRPGIALGSVDHNENRS
jgi:hypothetical protein